MTIGQGLQSLEASLAGRAIGPDDVLALRRAFYVDGVIQPGEAESLCRIEAAAAAGGSPEWSALYVEALVDFIVHQQLPVGHVSEENARWLVDRISKDGVVRSETELELLVKVMEAAASVPPQLARFALSQVARAVIDGDGPLARGGRLQPGIIGRDEVELLRRILFAAGHEGSIGVSREEAEVLFDLNDRTREAANDPAWSDLFVKAIANFLMAARGLSVPPREEALRREAWLDAPTGGVGSLFGSMLSSLLSNGLRGIWASSGPSLQAERNAAVEEATRVAEAVTSDEVKWLADRIGRDGVIHDNERALLEFLAEESPDLHPSLRTLLDTAA